MGPNLSVLIYVVAFLAMVLGVESVVQMLLSSRDQKRRVNRRLTMLESGMLRDDVYSALVRKPVVSFGTDTQISRIYDGFCSYCRKAGPQYAPSRVLGVAGAGTVVLWLASLLFVGTNSFTGVVANSFLALAMSAIICGLFSRIWLGRVFARRLAQIEDQLPLALDVIIRAIRAGHPVVSAVQLAAEEMGDPIGSEFGLIVDETTYGYSFRDALTNFARRTGSQDGHFFAVSVAIQSETGGNLAEILEGLAKVIRGRSSLSKRVKALSSEGRASAMLLSALPALLIASMMLFRPEFYTSKFSDPIFWPATSVIFGLYLLGWVIIHRIIHFRY